MEHFSQSNYNYISLTKILVFFLFILYVAPCLRWLIIYFLYYENKFPDAYLNKFIKRSHNLFERCCRIQILLQEQYILFKLIKIEFAREWSSRNLTTMGYYTGTDPAFVIRGEWGGGGWRANSKIFPSDLAKLFKTG